MTPLSLKYIKSMAAGRLSSRTMYLLVITVALVFCAFYLVGFDMPYEENPSFNAPLLTDAVAALIYIFVFIATMLTICSAVNGIRLRDRSSSTANNIPAARITAIIAIATAACMAVTFMLGSSEPMTVNGTKYNDMFWLKTTDMFINTASVLLVLAVCGVIFGLSGYNRKIKLKKRNAQ